ncbi:MAG: MATE family efflux transporter [Devosiaceae bacterium]|nr:MATE family efflux transporter [Devosiaceae bacterium]
MPTKSPKTADWASEFRATLTLAWPLVVAQLAGIALSATDVIMMGWLGANNLAAGSLANSIFFTLFLGGVGLVTATAPLFAQAIGARQNRSIRKIIRQGFWLAAAFSILATPLVLQLGPVFRLLGQDPQVISLAETYLSSAVWMLFPGFGIVIFRSLLAARGDSKVILWVTVGGIFINALANYGLMFGNFGLPRLEMLGAGITTSLVNLIMFGILLAFVVFNSRYRRYYILVRPFKPDWPRFRQLLFIGAPISLTIMSEVGLFGAASILMGLLGTDELAAHAIALQLAAIAFMVPLGISQATTVRVGIAYGAKSPLGVGIAGWTSMGLGTVFMVLPLAIFLLFPAFLVTLFLDPTNPNNLEVLALAASFLAVAAAFQLVDGAQILMVAALRGLSDTKIPMFLALFGYWIVGMGTAYLFGFLLEWRGIGIWIGLASGLAFVAIVLTVRFAMREKLSLL